jgi:subtilisin family serine protease
MPIVAYKAFDAEGLADLDLVWQAYKLIIAKLQAKTAKFAAINLSIGTDFLDSATIAIECGYVKQMASYGVMVLAAAGNMNGGYFGVTAPATCSDAMAVTSITSSNLPDRGSSVAYPASSAAVKSKIISAPGGEIYSTYLQRGFVTMSGTSMATPHVSHGHHPGLCHWHRHHTVGMLLVHGGSAISAAV